jgi:peptidyl-prolyl cis-trans isomerase SurA
MGSTASTAANPVQVGGFTGACYRTAAMGLLPVALFLIAGCNRAHPDDVVATVNGHAIMRADMDRMYQAQLAQAQGQQQSAEEADSLRLSAVRELINEEILDQRAAKMNLTATPEEVDAKLNAMKAPYNEEQWADQLRANHTTLDDFKHDMRRSLTTNKLLNKEVYSKVTVSDADVADYYRQHKTEFNFIETMYHLAVIRVTSVPSPQPVNLQGSKATTDAEAKKKIQALKNRLDSGEDFGAIAAGFSEDPNTSSSGGDMGFVPESQLKSDPTVGAAILKLNPGQMTEIFPLIDAQSKKPIGYSIYKLIEREPVGQREISDPVVQQKIRQLLHDGRSQLVQNAYFEMLRDQAKVENFLADQILKNDAK